MRSLIESRHKMVEYSKKEDDLIIEKAIGLSLVEVLLGTLLHASRVPFAGQLLSLNQGAFLCHYTLSCTERLRAAKNILNLSVVVAMMKTLSYSGKKLGPMISISMQGLLYSLGIIAGGTGLRGRVLAMIMLSLWAIIWPLVTYFFIYGADLALAFSYFAKKMQDYLGTPPDTLLLAIASFVFIKLLMAIGIALFMQRKGKQHFERYEEFLQKMTRFPLRAKKKTPFPLDFLFSFVIMGCFFYFNETDNALFLQKMMRALALGILFLSLFRSPWPIQLISKLFPGNKSVQHFALLSQKALQGLQKKLER